MITFHLQSHLLCMHSIVLEDNSNSLRYWIYTSIITTYRMNKRGFDCALSRATSRASFRRFSASLHFPPLFFFLYITQVSCTGFYFSFLSCTPSRLEPLTFRIHLAYQSFFYTTTPRDSVEAYPPKLNFILLDSLACPKINITIYCMLHACCTLYENIHRICGSLENKRWRRWFIFFSQSLPPELSIKLQSSVSIYKCNVFP